MENEKIICSICGEVIEDGDDSHKVDGEYVCDDCFNEYYIECEDCGNYYSDDSLRYVEHYGYVCDDCINNGDYGYCARCDNLYRGDDLNYSERNDEYYCDDCYDESEDLIYGYHDFDDWHFYKGKNEENAPYYIGKEIELEGKGGISCLEDVLRTMNKTINAVGMHDGSLSSSGVEIVTHPESWQYLQEHKNDYEAFFTGISNLNYGDGGHTGLHFHVSRPSDDVISRIIVILESFKDEIKTLSRRNGDFHWANFITDRFSRDDKLTNLKYKSTKFLKEKYVNKYQDDRYMALNLCNTNTIEFRFFKGVNNFEEFWGALQFIHNIMEVALDETRDLNSINWQDLLVGDEIKAQAKKLGVSTISKTAFDTTEIIEKIEKAQEETKKTIQRTLRNFIKYLTREMETKKLEIIDINDIYEIERNGQDYLNTIASDMRYLQRITRLYRDIDENTIDESGVKYGLQNIKNNTINMKKYERYFEQIDTAIQKYEEEASL